MVSSLWYLGPPFTTNDLFSSLLGVLSADDLAYWLNLGGVQECIPSTGSYLPSEAISRLITGQYWQWMLQPWLLWWKNSSRLIHHHISPVGWSESGITIELQINLFFSNKLSEQYESQFPSTKENLVLSLLWKESRRFSRNWGNVSGSGSSVQIPKGHKRELINFGEITCDLQFNTLAKALGNNVNILWEWLLEAGKKFVPTL